VLLVMATGTGKTYTAFQIIWRLWKAGRAKRVLYPRHMQPENRE
jgi:type I restriction enzyme, R subunit